MATTVNMAFNEFMRDSVNLDPNVVSRARASRDNLLANISEFNHAPDFFNLYEDINVHFGSFARKTKCRELDDIDLMIGISGDGGKYRGDDPWDNVRIIASETNPAQQECSNSDGTLNSIKVANRFKKKLEHVREYRRSEIKRNGEAIVLNLISKDWSFDIVPCFYTEKENGRNYYLIPNGKGNWKKTDPHKDQHTVTYRNQATNGRLLELIRLCKKWNKVKHVKTMPSYLMETMLVNYCFRNVELPSNLSHRFTIALDIIRESLYYSAVYDMQGIQGDLLHRLTDEERAKIRVKADYDSKKAWQALKDADQGNNKEAIQKWGEIFGSDFPIFG